MPGMIQTWITQGIMALKSNTVFLTFSFLYTFILQKDYLS